jgi:hypothetical protein
VQNPEDFDPALEGSIEDKVLLEARNGEEANAFKKRIVGLIAGTDPGRSSQSLKGRLCLAQETVGRGNPR